MFSVALIGPDGAGKTTISRRLEQLLPLPVKYLYMGGSRRIEIIKRLRGAKPVEAAAEREIDHARHPRGGVKRAAASLRMSLSLINQICEEWYHQGLSWYYQFRGHVVIFDRHFFFDYHSHDAIRSNQEQPLTKRVRIFILDRVFPKPDLVIYLDAPADVLFTRKGEGTLSRLENQRQGFLQMRDKFRNFFVLDANQSEGDVARVASDLIRGFYLARIGIKTPGYSGTTKGDSRYL
jgi:thymidylate kinase